MELSLSVKQTQTLSPQMMQSMEILQMGSQDLLEYIQEQVQENPVLEMEEHYGQGGESEILQRKLEWLSSSDDQNRYYYQQDGEDGDKDPISNYGTVSEQDENLYFYVASQLEPMDLQPALLEICRYLVESLNQNGWLDESLEDLAKEWNRPLSLLEEGLAVIQDLEPSGVGARTLSECLCLQLCRRHEEESIDLAIWICKDYLDPLSKNRYGLLAKELGVTQEEVRAASELIRSLNPRPGGGFATRENLTYINPDLFVVKLPDHFELLTNDYFFPKLNMSNYYAKMLKGTEDGEVKDYLMSKAKQAKWVVRSIEQRRSTLVRCAETILELQEEFFRRGPGHLKPMGLMDVAQRIEVHESTVSRTVKDKYIQCASGVYPLSYFFSRSLGTPARDNSGAECCNSPDFAKCLLKKLVDGENRKKPLSDQKLCQLMEAEGCKLSRRTVAKYRDELHIPCTTGRKQYE